MPVKKSLTVADVPCLVEGRVLKIARAENEWRVDLPDPQAVIRALQQQVTGIDIFTFWQRFPDGVPRYSFAMERESIAVLPITTFDEWWSKGISPKTRNMVRKASKKGVETRLVAFDDALIDGIVEIFNETPVRQGRPFWHYNKSAHRVKTELSESLERSQFIGAYLGEKLIGYVKLLETDRYVMLVQILSMLKFRDYATTNALLATTVEVCASRGATHLVYAYWSERGLGAFKSHNGFTKVDLPRYYVPLTVKGRWAIRTSLHHGIRNVLPTSLVNRLLDYRARWYARTRVLHGAGR